MRWLGESQLTAEALLAHPTREGRAETSQVGRACRWLEQALAAGSRPEEELRLVAEEEGIRYASLRRAKKALGVESERPDFVAPWRWRLATDAETEERPATENQAS